MNDMFELTAEVRLCVSEQQAERLTSELAEVRAELQRALEQNARLDARLLELQHISERADRADVAMTGGARFDTRQAFGHVAYRPDRPDVAGGPE